MRSLIVVLLLAGVAHAGDICATDDHGNIDRTPDLKVLDKLARRQKLVDREAFDAEYFEYCLYGDKADAERIANDCEAILDREPKHGNCMVVLASIGRTVVGKHDVFAFWASQPIGPWDTNPSTPDYPPPLLAAMGDPRGLKLLVDAWNKGTARAAKLKRGSGAFAEWSSWRQHAAEALAVLGGADEATFLATEAAATKDKYVAKACLDAKVAIEKRLAKP